MRVWACRLACLKIGPLSPPHLGIRLCQKRSLNLHHLCIRGELVLVPVRLNPVALSKVLPRVLAPRGGVIGTLRLLRLVIGSNAGGTNKLCEFQNCVHFDFKNESVCISTLRMKVFCTLSRKYEGVLYPFEKQEKNVCVFVNFCIVYENW